MKDFSEFLMEKRIRKKFLSYSLDRQDEIIDRINREKFKKMDKEADEDLEDMVKNPQNYFWY